MYIACIVLIFIAAVMLILAVLAQNPKGGMAANFGVSNQVMGVRQTADFLEKSTWGLALTILVLSLVATMTMPKENISRSKSGIEKMLMDERSAEADGIGNQMDFSTEGAAASTEGATQGQTTEGREQNAE